MTGSNSHMGITPAGALPGASPSAGESREEEGALISMDVSRCAALCFASSVAIRALGSPSIRLGAFLHSPIIIEVMK